uniref:Uncharacterized protein n=1 Tax=Fundulus heteroclitus TaxID=8078 RepID=A0A3Q2PCZ0_FUNHE
MGTLGQWMRKTKMANRLTSAHIIQKRMMPRQLPPPPAGTTIRKPPVPSEVTLEHDTASNIRFIRQMFNFDFIQPQQILPQD